MRDIVVTTPKSRMAEAAREAEEVRAAGGGYYYRDYRAPRIPNVETFDRVYYIEDGYVRGYCLITEIDSVGYGRRRSITIYMDARLWTWIKPIPVGNSPRSWVYADTLGISWEDVEIVGGWLEPKPEVVEPCRR
ncbi:MAG TPA: hypothetical protein VMW93_03480 [bacterium]|nr:hypothetical protein [bacterium]